MARGASSSPPLSQPTTQRRGAAHSASASLPLSHPTTQRRGRTRRERLSPSFAANITRRGAALGASASLPLSPPGPHSPTPPPPRSQVRLRFIVEDLNPYRLSSAGVLFSTLSDVSPAVGRIVRVLGFVEELAVDDDTEFEWRDKFRRARESNEQRTLLLYKLSASVRRSIGRKLLAMGGNAVLAYQPAFDVEGDSGVVARACGTACLVLMHSHSEAAAAATAPAPLEHAASFSAAPTPVARLERSLSHLMLPGPRADESSDAALTDVRAVLLLTLRQFAPTVRLHFGGVVTARSVKYLGKMGIKLADQETRDSWWSELRDEVRAHARSLSCSAVVAYVESTTIYNDCVVLSASGTAVTIRNLVPPPPAAYPPGHDAARPRRLSSRMRRHQSMDSIGGGGWGGGGGGGGGQPYARGSGYGDGQYRSRGAGGAGGTWSSELRPTRACTFCHVPYRCAQASPMSCRSRTWLFGRGSIVARSLDRCLRARERGQNARLISLHRFVFRV